MKKHRISALLLTAVLAASALSGCAATPAASAAAPASTPTSTSASASEKDGTQIFTDSLGREVELPTDLQRIAPSGTLSQIILYTIAPDKLVGWTSNPTDAMKKYFDEKYTDLPTFGTFYGKNADLNTEALIAAAPQVVIDMGEVKGKKEDMIADLDSLQKQIGIPVVFIENYLQKSGDSYAMLGKLLGMESEAQKLTDYCNKTISEANEAVAKIPEDKRVRLYYGEGDTGLQTNPRGSFHCEVLDLVGAVNVADIPVTSGSGGNQISMEQLLLWAPDVMILGPGSIYDTIGTDPLFKDLKAVQEKCVYQIPSGPYNWLDRPPAINRIIGIKWLGNLLYPEQFQYDMVAEAKEFYSLFYHYDLSDEEAKTILEKS
ncbi:MAG: ABC transporter substrate-binding protein [Ruthenibacterium sp.]